MFGRSLHADDFVNVEVSEKGPRDSGFKFTKA